MWPNQSLDQNITGNMRSEKSDYICFYKCQWAWARNQSLNVQSTGVPKEAWICIYCEKQFCTVNYGDEHIFMMHFSGFFILKKILSYHNHTLLCVRLLHKIPMKCIEVWGWMFVMNSVFSPSGSLAQKPFVWHSVFITPLFVYFCSPLASLQFMQCFTHFYCKLI